MKINEFAKGVVRIIKNNPEQIQDYIKKGDWEGLQDEIYYNLGSMMEDAEC